MKAKLIVTAMVVGFSALTASVLAQQLQNAASNGPLTGRKVWVVDPSDTERSDMPNVLATELNAFWGRPAYATLTGEELESARKADELLRRLSTTEDAADKDELKAQLQEVLEQQFDLRHKRHTLEIDALEAKVTRLKELVQKRQESRADIIAKRLDQLDEGSGGTRLVNVV